jgi:hypothetical protein
MTADPKLWYTDDQLAFYTWWSQRKTSVYQDPDAAFFPFYLPPGIQAAMFFEFNQRKETLSRVERQDKALWVRYIWRVIHPPSYFLAMEIKAKQFSCSPETMDKFYGRHAKQFEDVPMDFNIFSKRCISFLVGDGNHFNTYFIFHAGELFCNNSSSTRSGKARPECFYCCVDSLGYAEGRPPASREKFVMFLLEIIFQLEQWITTIIHLAEPGQGEEMLSPNLADIADIAYERIMKKTSIFFQRDFASHNKFYTQPDSWNCGACAVLNVTAAYVADALYHQPWVEVRSPLDFFQAVMLPFWQLPKGGKMQHRSMMKRLKIFRFNFIKLAHRSTRETEAYYPQILRRKLHIFSSPGGRPAY